jgi:hypothetical protein
VRGRVGARACVHVCVRACVLWTWQTEGSATTTGEGGGGKGYDNFKQIRAAAY